MYTSPTDLAPNDRRPPLTRQHEIRSPPHRSTTTAHRFHPHPLALAHNQHNEEKSIRRSHELRFIKIKCKMQTIMNRPPSQPWQRPHRLKKGFPGIKVPKRPSSWYHISFIRLPSATGARCTSLLMLQPLTGDTNIYVKDDRDRCL